MSKRISFILLSVLFISVGALVYVLFRPTTYITHLFKNILRVEMLWEILGGYGSNFLKFYFPDFLWAISLCFGLYAIYLPTIKTSIMLSVIVFVYGVIWEILQAVEVLGGTGDIVDVIMYLLACLLALIFNLKKEKTK